jgi:tetratricopeptide (TPR) repeat protein
MTTRMLLLALFLAAPLGALADETADAYQASNDLELAGRYREALQAMDGVPSTGRGEYVYHLRRAWLCYLAGDHRESVDAYRQAIAMAPRAVEPRLGLMLPQMALHLWVDAEQTAVDTLALDPRSYLAGSRRAWALYNLGRYDEAEVAYRRVLELYPGDTEMRTGLGWCLLKLDRGADSAAQFRQVLRVDPADASAQQGLAASGS